MINIAKLLKNCPEGLPLYSLLLGPVVLRKVNLQQGDYPIAVSPINADERYYFDAYGRYLWKFDDAECLLFPSKECRTWENFKLPVQPKFKVGNWIVRNHDGFTRSIESLKDGSYYFNQGGSFPIKAIDEYYHLWTIADAKDGDVLATNWHEDDDSWEKIVIFKKYHTKGVNGLFNTPCIEGYGNTFKNGKLAFQEEVPYYSKTWTMNLRPATKEQVTLLFAKMREAGYEWDAYKKELKKIQPHYDIANFHAGMPVLVRIDNSYKWSYTLFSHYNEGWNHPFSVASCCSTKQCIPFNKDTEHLLGTTDMCPKEYINW